MQFGWLVFGMGFVVSVVVLMFCGDVVFGLVGFGILFSLLFLLL